MNKNKRQLKRKSKKMTEEKRKLSIKLGRLSLCQRRPHAKNFIKNLENIPEIGE